MRPSTYFRSPCWRPGPQGRKHATGLDSVPIERGCGTRTEGLSSAVPIPPIGAGFVARFATLCPEEALIIEHNRHSGVKMVHRQSLDIPYSLPQVILDLLLFRYGLIVPQGYAEP